MKLERHDEPLNVLPSVNHWMQDDKLKRVGVGEERMTSATPPVKRPVVPERRLAKDGGGVSNNHWEVGENSFKILVTMG